MLGTTSYPPHNSTSHFGGQELSNEVKYGHEREYFFRSSLAAYSDSQASKAHDRHLWDDDVALYFAFGRPSRAWLLPAPARRGDRRTSKNLDAGFLEKPF